MRRTVIVSGLAIAVGATALEWLDYRHAVRALSTQVYVSVIAVLFAAVGLWVGLRMTRKELPAPFEKNAQAMRYLGISEREYEVLELLAEGHSNKEIAKRLFVSGNTVKTHLAHLYQKLEVARRTQAVQKARSLQLIP